MDWSCRPRTSWPCKPVQRRLWHGPPSRTHKDHGFRSFATTRNSLQRWTGNCPQMRAGQWRRRLARCPHGDGAVHPHEPHEPVKNDAWAPPKHPALAGLVLDLCQGSENGWLGCGGWPLRSGPTRLGCELDPGRHAQLGEDVGEMGFHCAPGDEQAPTDLDVGESLTHQPYHLELGGSETFPSPRGSPARPSSASADT